MARIRISETSTSKPKRTHGKTLRGNSPRETHTHAFISRTAQLKRVQRARKMVEEKKDTQPRKYEVFVDDNFHYMDESERYKLGTFKTCEEATAVCKRIVDEFLEQGYEEGMS